MQKLYSYSLSIVIFVAAVAIVPFLVIAADLEDGGGYEDYSFGGGYADEGYSYGGGYAEQSYDYGGGYADQSYSFGGGWADQSYDYGGGTMGQALDFGSGALDSSYSFGGGSIESAYDFGGGFADNSFDFGGGSLDTNYNFGGGSADYDNNFGGGSLEDSYNFGGGSLSSDFTFGSGYTDNSYDFGGGFADSNYNFGGGAAGDVYNFGGGSADTNFSFGGGYSDANFSFGGDSVCGPGVIMSADGSCGSYNFGGGAADNEYSFGGGTAEQNFSMGVSCANGQTPDAKGSCGSGQDVALGRDNGVDVPLGRETGVDVPLGRDGGIDVPLGRENQLAAAYQPRYASAGNSQISTPRYSTGSSYRGSSGGGYYGNTGGWSHGRVESAVRTSSTGYVGGGSYGGGYSYPQPPRPPVYPPQPPVYPPQYPQQPTIPQGVRCDAFYFTNQYGQRAETAYQGENVTLVWSTIGGQAQGIMGLGSVQASGSRSFNNFKIGTHQLTLRVIGQGTGNQTDCTATITINQRSVPQPPHGNPGPMYPPQRPPVAHYPQPCCIAPMPVYPYQQPVIPHRPMVYPQTTYHYAMHAPSPVVYVGEKQRVEYAPAPVYTAAPLHAISQPIVLQQLQQTLCADGTTPVRSATTGKLTCYTQATCPVGTYPQGEQNGMLICAQPSPAPVVSVVQKPVYQIVEKPVYVPQEIIVEKQVKPTIKIVTNVVDPVEKVTLDTLPETGAEDYFMPLFYIATLLSAVYVARNVKMFA